MPLLLALSKGHAAQSFDAGLKGICSFVFEREDDFPQILDFTNHMSQQYGLNVHKLHADFRSGVEGLLEVTQLKAIILGTRRYSILHGITTLQPSHDFVPCLEGCPALRPFVFLAYPCML